MATVRSSGQIHAREHGTTVSRARRAAEQTPLDTLLALQRSAGNTAVRGVVSGDQPLARVLMLQRQLPFVTPTATPTRPARINILDKERTQLETDTRFDMGLAFTQFASACQYNAAALKAAARADADFANMIVDVLTGFAAPAFASYVGSKLVGKMTERFENFAKVKAKNPSPIYDFVSGAADSETIDLTLLSKSDALKGFFTGATKVANERMKKHAVALFGDTPTDQFLRAIQDSYQVELSDLAKQLPKMSLKELLAVSIAFDPQYANLQTYLADIKRKTAMYKREVSVIGLPTSGGGKTRLIKVGIDSSDKDGRGGLAIAERVKDQFTGQIGRVFFDWEFVNWVGSSMSSLAIAQHKRTFGATTPIPVVNQMKIRNLD